MKKYIRVASIEAEPMTMEEALKNNLIKINEVTSENCGSIEGYHVIYDNGRESWISKDMFARTYKVADTPLDRLRIEYDELMDKHNKLVLFLGRKDAVDIAGEDQVALMELQKIQMHDYLITLKKRIDLMK
nr:MAG TPA: hypothetical protein [Caudoviricetes sp.]